LYEIKKKLQFVGKGHNETLETVNPLGRVPAAKDVSVAHVPKNRGT
jgi:hypothetical protein